VAPLLSPEDQPETMLGDLPENLNTGIYEILNVKNGRRYIGSAVNVSKRWREHLRQLEDGKHHSRFMQRCWNKNGSDCFVFRVVLSCEKENLLMYEQAFLDFHEPEYNSAKVAGSQLGFRHSEESRAKMSASRPKGFSPMKGRHHSDEAKRKISEAKTGVKQCRSIVRKRQDAIVKKYGDRKPCKRKFSENDIREIRSRCEQGAKNIELAREYGVSDGVISEIKNRKAYRWVE